MNKKLATYKEKIGAAIHWNEACRSYGVFIIVGIQHLPGQGPEVALLSAWPGLCDPEAPSHLCHSMILKVF